MSSQSSTHKTNTTQLIVIFCVGWAVLSLLTFLFFGVRAPGEETLPNWFLITINIYEIVAFALATVLCFRNASSSQVISGRGVWTSIGIGMLAYTLGDIFFALWGTYWGLDPAVSLGDFFYLLSYVFLFIGLLRAVLPRRIDLTLPQWILIVGIGVIGVLLAYWLNYGVEAIEFVEADALEAVPTTAPGWAIAVDNALEPFEDIVGLLYVIADCLLVVIAGTLLVAFWGGRFSQTWRLIAIAAFSLYIADMVFAYDLSRDAYVEGSFWEIFWILSAIFFALGAAVEYDISTQSRRGLRRRQQ
ncbi:MAG: hypothetical protein F6J97_10090 [Leptolyngbya sp. SIO4C1]|nr:hypothetical protein [Leptolyngbya sp. SIO4C1]